MKQNKEVTYYLLLVAIFFLISSTRGLFINEKLTEWVLFFILLGGIYIANKVRAVWITFYLYILAIFYNPFFLIIHDFQYSYIADILIAITFFFLALKWQSYAFEEPMG